MIDAGSAEVNYWDYPPNLNGLSSKELLTLPPLAFMHYMAASRSFRETIYGVSAARAMEHPSCMGNGKALDFGCGVGYDAVSLCERGWNVTLVDQNRWSREVAATWLHRLGFSSFAELEVAEIPAGQFSLVHSYGVLHHIEDVEPVVRRLQRAVAPGGLLQLMLYTEMFVPWPNKRSDGKREGPYTRGYTLEEANKLLGMGWTVCRAEVWNQGKYRAITASRIEE